MGGHLGKGLLVSLRAAHRGHGRALANQRNAAKFNPTPQMVPATDPQGNVVSLDCADMRFPSTRREWPDCHHLPNPQNPNIGSVRCLCLFFMQSTGQCPFQTHHHHPFTGGKRGKWWVGVISHRVRVMANRKTRSFCKCWSFATFANIGSLCKQ